MAATTSRGVIDQSTLRKATDVITALSDKRKNDKVVCRVRLDVFGDPLVGVIDLVIRLKPVESVVLHVAVDERARQPGTPEEAEPLFGKAIKCRHDRRADEHARVQHGESDKLTRPAIRNGRHEIAADITVHDVQRVDCQEQPEQQGEPANRRRSDFGEAKKSRMVLQVSGYRRWR